MENQISNMRQPRYIASVKLYQNKDRDRLIFQTNFIVQI